MGKNHDKDNVTKNSVIDLDGWEFKRVKNGLDETQVISAINELISQRSELIQRTDHLGSLTKLAEKKVAEADKLAEDVKRETIEQAKTEANSIIAEADAQAQQIISEKRAEIMNVAKNEAATIKVEAERKARLLLEEGTKKLQHELEILAHGLYSQLLSELESLKQRVVTLRSESEHKLSQSQEETTSTPEANEIHTDFQELIKNVDPTISSDPVEETSAPAQDLNTIIDDSGLEWQLEVLPPIDIMKILEIITYLDGLPQVESTELVPDPNQPSIMVSLREPTQLIDILQNYPKVAHVEEDAQTTGNQGTPRKACISLLDKTVSQKAK